MNALLAVLLGWVALGLENGLKQTFSLRLSETVVSAPSFVIPVAAFIAICAPAHQALWACLALGLGMDLTALRDGPVVIGPYAVGLALGCQLVLALRGLMIRRNPLTLVVLSVLMGLVCQVWVTAVFTARRVVDHQTEWHATAELASRIGSAVLTGGSALALSLLLLPLAPLLGLAGGHAKPWQSWR